MRPLALLLAWMLICAGIAGLTGYILASRGDVILFEPLASQVPKDKHVSFIVDLWSHSASYLVGFVGGIVLIVRVKRSRAAR